MFSHYFLAVKPGLDKMKWEEVASKMNIELHLHGYWRSNNFFSSGKDCHYSFREYLLRPSLTFESEVLEAVTQYKHATDKLYLRFLEDLFPSDAHFLPINEEYGRFTLLIHNRAFLKTVLRWICLLVYLFGTDWRFILKILTVYGCIRKFLEAYESHLEGKYRALDVTSILKFLAAITHFAPGNDYEKWDQIASHMNWYLHAEGIWTGTHEKFLDGKECLHFYESQFMDLVSGDNTSPYWDLRHIVSAANRKMKFFYWQR